MLRRPGQASRIARGGVSFLAGVLVLTRVAGLWAVPSGVPPAPGEAHHTSRPSGKPVVPPVLMAGSLLAGLVILHSFDGDIRNRVDHQEQGFGRRGTLWYEMGSIGGIATLSGGFYLGGMFGGSSSARQTGVTLAKSAVVTGLCTIGLKHLIGRSRPLPRSDPDFFDPFSGADSFPSGHTSLAFTMAAVVTDRYPAWWVQLISYGAAGTVGFARMTQDTHWASDIAAGAALGVVVGKAVSRWDRRRHQANRFLSTDGRRFWLTHRWG